MARKQRTLLHEMAFCYFAKAVWEGIGLGVDEVLMQKRTSVALEKLLEWTADSSGAESVMQDLGQETNNLIACKVKSKADLVDLYQQSLERIKEHVPQDQLPFVISDMKDILINPRPGELDSLKNDSEFLGVPFESSDRGIEHISTADDDPQNRFGSQCLVLTGIVFMKRMRCRVGTTCFHLFLPPAA